MSALRFARAAVGTAVALTLAPPAAGAQLTHGGFETPVVGANTFVGRASGTTFGGWTVASGNVDHIGAGYWEAAEGVQSLDLNGNQAGAIYQNVMVTPGSSYDLFFALAGNPASGPAVKTVQVLWGPTPESLVPVGTFTFDVTGRTFAAMGWSEQSAAGLTATSGTMTLQFASLTVGAYGPVVDDVTLLPAVNGTVVPEPSTVVLLASGLLLLGIAAARRRGAPRSP